MPTSRRLLPALLVLAITGGGGALLAAGPALGATAPAAPSDKAIAQRLASLHTWQTKLAADETLAPADRTTLTDLLRQDVTGLTALQATIASDTDPAVRKTAAAKIYTDYQPRSSTKAAAPLHLAEEASTRPFLTAGPPPLMRHAGAPRGRGRTSAARGRPHRP